MNAEQKPRRRYELTLYEGKSGTNRQKVEDEFDAFWVKAPMILSVESRGPSKGQVYTIEAELGFNKVWRNENELDIKNSIRKAEESYKEDDHER